MKSIILSVLLFLSLTAFSQQKQSAQSSVGLEIYGGDGAGASADYFYDWGLGKKQRIKIGLGLRYTAFFGKDLFYITAPAKLTSGKTGPGVLFTENITGNIDSLLIQNPQTHALNLALSLGYQFLPKWDASFTIDLLGFSFGRKFTDGLYIHENNSGGAQANIEGKPTVFNALLISDNDRGSLYSAVSLRYHINDSWGVRAGAAFVFSEYTTREAVQQLPSPNNRFRYKSLTPMIGISRMLKNR